MRRSIAAVILVAALAVSGSSIQAQGTRAPGCDADNAGLTLPAGFCAGVFARGVPAARHIAVASTGDVFVISNSGRAGRGGTGPQRGVYRLRDANNDGKADSVERVADGTGSGLWIANNALYAEGGGSMIVRYPFAPNGSDLTGAIDTIVTGLPTGGNHPTRDFVIRGGDLFVNVGSATNACTQGGGRSGAPITQPDPCVELPTRAGVWKFSATEKNQVFSTAQRFVTGLRNGVGISLNPNDNEVYSTQHGRDDLGRLGNQSFEYNAENPGEEFFKLVAGADYGWPYCYYSVEEKKKVTAPEYGGDGKKTDRCANVQAPLYAFPGHWAPNASMFYAGTQFPAEYRDGVFVAFHGSWNRGPLPTDQKGFNITFLPMKNGQAAGTHRVFADGFRHLTAVDSASAPYTRRPAGLGQAKDGALLVSDDQGGLIYRIVYARR